LRTGYLEEDFYLLGSIGGGLHNLHFLLNIIRVIKSVMM